MAILVADASVEPAGTSFIASPAVLVAHVALDAVQSPPPPPHATLHHPHAPRDRRAPLAGTVNQGRRRTAVDARRRPALGFPGSGALVALTTEAAPA